MLEPSTPTVFLFTVTMSSKLQLLIIQNQIKMAKHIGIVIVLVIQIEFMKFEVHH